MRIIANCLRAALIPALITAAPTALYAQSWQWATASTNVSSDGSFGIAAMALDGAGNTVVAGSFLGTVTLGSFTLTSTLNSPDGFVGRLNNAGEWTQVVRAGGNGARVSITALALDNAGNAVVAGEFSGPSISFGPTTLTNAGVGRSTDVFVARLSSTGTWTQAVRAGSTDSESVTGLALDATGNAIVGGGFWGPTISFGTMVLRNASPADPYDSPADIFIARLSPAGAWTQAIAAGGTKTDYLNALAVDATGTVSVVGNFTSPVITFGTTTLANSTPQSSHAVITAFVARLNSAGSWTQATANTLGLPIPKQVAIDADGNTIVSGYFSGAAADFGSTILPNSDPQGDNCDIFVARLGRNGSWTQAVRAGGTGDDRTAGLGLDASGNAYVLGDFKGPTAAFGSLTLTNANPTTELYGPADLYVARLSTAGTWTNAVRTGDMGHEAPMALAVNSAGSKVGISAWYTAPVTIGPFAFPQSTGTSSVVAQLSGLTLGVKRAASVVVGLAPNPAHSSTQLALPAEISAHSVLLLDALGREVRRQSVPVRATSATLNVAGLPSGLYMVHYGAARARLVVE